MPSRATTGPAKAPAMPAAPITVQATGATQLTGRAGADES